jgi:hypothetical protein
VRVATAKGGDDRLDQREGGQVVARERSVESRRREVLTALIPDDTLHGAIRHLACPEPVGSEGVHVFGWGPRGTRVGAEVQARCVGDRGSGGHGVPARVRQPAAHLVVLVVHQEEFLAGLLEDLTDLAEVGPCEGERGGNGVRAGTCAADTDVRLPDCAVDGPELLDAQVPVAVGEHVDGGAGRPRVAPGPRSANLCVARPVLALRCLNVHHVLPSRFRWNEPV